VVGAFGVPVGTGLGKEIVKSASNSKSKELESSLSGSDINISSSTGGNGKNVKDFIKSSILEKELSPLQMILNSEIILNVLILLHICLIN